MGLVWICALLHLHLGRTSSSALLTEHRIFCCISLLDTSKCYQIVSCTLLLYRCGNYSLIRRIFIHRLKKHSSHVCQCTQAFVWMGKRREITVFDLDSRWCFPKLKLKIETPVIVLTFQTSCFVTSHEKQHSAPYPPSSASVQTMYAALPCDFNWMIRCNSISNRRAVRVSLRRKAKEHWWVGSLSVTFHHCCYLSG